MKEVEELKGKVQSFLISQESLKTDLEVAWEELAALEGVKEDNSKLSQCSTEVGLLLLLGIFPFCVAL